MRALVALLLLAASSAHAADAVSLRARRSALVGEEPPSLTFDTTVAGHLQASLACGSKRFSLDTAIQPGGSYPMALAGLPKGEHRCAGNLTLTASDGSTGQMPLSLGVAVVAPLALQVSAADLDLDGHAAMLQADRPVSDVQIDVFGPSGTRIGGGRTPGQDQTRVPLTWASDGEVVRIDLTATDLHGFRSVLQLTPWSYNIPHEDVVFASGADAIETEQVPKLDHAWAQVQDVIARYGQTVPIQLYVAGHTDTVGDAASNQALSERRARAIAGWFRNKGFAGDVFFQGFGETGLAVVTADGTDEPANRRAHYILAAQTPPISTGLPGSHWKRL